MVHLALYRALRPQNFDQVIAQKHVVYPLRQAVINGTSAHAYLFSGTRGTGKTSIAKIFAKALNCLDPQDGNPCGKCECCKLIETGATLDVSEIDAASNNSVDNIRHIVEEINYVPANCRYKVYIIDEAHMLSDSAFNALLKTLEEPPEHAVFILATTEPNRIRTTILSRCQRYDFRLIPSEDMQNYLTEVAKDQGYNFTSDGINAIVRTAQGAMRDAISILEQVGTAVPGVIDRKAVLSQLGSAQDNRLRELLEAITDNNLADILSITDQLILSGVDTHRLVLEFAEFLRNLLVIKACKNSSELLNFTDDKIEELSELATNYSVNQLIRLITSLHKLNNDLRFSGENRTALEIGLLSLVDSSKYQHSNSDTQNKSSTKQRPSKSTSQIVGQKAERIIQQSVEQVSEPSLQKNLPLPPEDPSAVSPNASAVAPFAEPSIISTEESCVAPVETLSVATTQETCVAPPVERKVAENGSEITQNTDGELDNAALHKLVEQNITDRFNQICLNNAQFVFDDGKWQIIYDDSLNANIGYCDIVQKNSGLLEQLRSILVAATGKDGLIVVRLVKSSTKVENTQPEWIKKIQATREAGFDFPIEIREK